MSWWCDVDPRPLLWPVRDPRREAARAVLAHLGAAIDAPLLEAHRCMLEQTFRANGLERMKLGAGPLAKLADEIRRRGLVTMHWTMELRERGDAWQHAWLN